MDLFIRESYLKKIRGFYDTDDLIKVITGVRRCGKSSLMQMIAAEIRQKGVPEENIIYLDLDMRKYRRIKTPDALEQTIEGNGHAEGLKYLFIDEVQNVKGFEDVLNGFRTDGGWSIFITGSNSYLLSGEITTKLTGRFLAFELFPLSFAEYVEMKRFYSKPVDQNAFIELSNYIQEGGFPRTVLLDPLADKRRYVQGVVEEIYEKDIRRRVKIRDKETFETVRRFVTGNFGSLFSLNNICEELRKQGSKITKATMSRYIRALLDAKIIYECPRFDIKSKKALSGEKKYYLSDLGFYFADNTDNRVNYGPVLENIVFLYARSLDYSVSVGRFGKFECDFILRDTELNYSYVQVAYTIALSKDTEEREYRPLESVKDNYPKYILTTDYILQRRNGIHHVNLMDFILSGKLF